MDTSSSEPDPFTPQGESGSPPTSRRERLRQVTLDEITAAAQRQLTEHGARGFSLRAVAREVGLTPSAIYRYFDSQTALVGAVAVGAYDHACRLLHEAADQHREASARDRLEAVFTAYRTWATTHPGEFELLFVTDQTLLADAPTPDAPTGLHRLVEVPLEVYVDGVARGELSPAPEPAGDHPVLSPSSEALRREVQERTGRTVTEGDVEAVLSAWGSVHGFVCLEFFGHLGLLLRERDERFRDHLAAALATLATTPAG